jgi:Histidine kinase
MSVVLPNSTVLAGGAHGVSRWMQGWSKMGRRHVVAWLFAASLMSVVDWTALIDKLDKPNVHFLMAFDLLTSLILFGVTLLAWIAATEGAPLSGRERNTRVAWAVAIAAVVAACITVPLMRSFEVDRMWWEMMDKVKPPPALALVIIGNSIHFVAWSGLFIAAAEVIRRRSLTNEAIRASQREQATLTRDVLESRLAAMQAQVEPQFLFDTLVDIEKLYQRDGAGAADQLDRLITYLRVALPRLREAGSTMDAEIDLVRAYLDVVRSARGGSPGLTVSIDNDCREARFYPMLLLPLVQRAVHGRNAALPASIRITVQRTGGDIAVVLRIAAPGGCAEDREIARVRERLTGLYGSRASLDCVELHSDTTQLTMRIPGAAREAAA